METLKKNWPLFVCAATIIAIQIGGMAYLRREMLAVRTTVDWRLIEFTSHVEKRVDSINEQLAKMDKTLDSVHGDTVMLRVEYADAVRSR